jgi:hypothetical protein
MKHFKIKFQEIMQIVMMLSGMMLMLMFSNAQVSNTSAYLPQVKLTADQGFGPYMIGTQCVNTFTISELPVNTSRVMFRFLDIDSNLVGQPYYKTGTALTSASWQVDLDTLGLPLSPQFHARVTFQTDSIADYFISYAVYPDTVSILASKGWGPFITNNYTFSNNSWQPVPELKNTFTVSNLPPRTEKILFKIITTDSLTMDSLLVTAQVGQYLESAEFIDVRMDNLPLSTHYLQVTVFSNGGPDQGHEFHKLLQLVQQKPRLTSHSEGITLADSILPCIKSPSYGQALMVDSIKYAEISNGPGGYNGAHRGPYSFDLINGHFSIEGWFRLNLNALEVLGQQKFILMDSAYYLTLMHNNYSNITFVFTAMVPIPEINTYDIFSGTFSKSLLAGKEWHHFAFTMNTCNGTDTKFYFDGQPVATLVNQTNVSDLGNTNYTHYLKTQPLHLGGKDIEQPSFVTAFDEVRIWSSVRTHSEIYTNMNRRVLQEPDLVAYWDFDDLRNRLNFISDEGVNNNGGTLKNGSAFIPEYPDIFATPDTMIINISNAATDSVLMAFIGEDGNVIDSLKIHVADHKVQWVYDLASLPYKTSYLRVFEPDPHNPSGGFETHYNVTVHAPSPIATSQYNWGLVCQSDNNFGSLLNSITVNGFPENTSKVELGLMNGNQKYNTETYTINSIPYQYSLTFNGTDNYFLKTAPQYKQNLDISLWFKTISITGGMILCDNDYNLVSHQDRELSVNADGSVSFKMFAYPQQELTLHAANRYNDGLWHYVRIHVIRSSFAKLYMDGCLVDQASINDVSLFSGNWVFGMDMKNWGNFFHGSLAEISIISSFHPNLDLQYPDSFDTTRVHYKLNEGTGYLIHNSYGGSELLQGSDLFWNKSNKLSSVIWQHNMIDKPVGWYTFYAKVYYAGGGEDGVYYPLGNYWLKEPFPDYTFGYNFSEGLGYFNEGVALQNKLVFKTNYTGQGHPLWLFNVLDLKLVAPGGQVIDEEHKVWLNNNVHDSVAIDVGDAPPGSYFHIAIGYETEFQVIYVNDIYIPLLIRPMLAPVLAGDFGPFEQAIAPGTMEHDNTFIVKTDGLSDITKVVADFYDPSGELVATTHGVKADDANWTITQNMAVLSPPVSTMQISYYLGVHHFLALVAGPYNITIHKTRPDWFDFVADSCFSNIQENGNEVTFEVTTPFDRSALSKLILSFTVPEEVPLIGGSESKLEMPTTNAYLKYTKSISTLELNQTPKFYQKNYNLGGGNADLLAFSMHNSQNNSYELDAHNNLIASQNFSLGGSVTSAFKTMAEMLKEIDELIELIENADVASIIVKPNFGITYTGAFQYSSRIRLMIDTLTGKWGSYGNLNVDADPEHEEAYKKSASYHFYAGSLGIELSVGMKVFEGLLSGNFGLDGRVVLGYGHSYVTIPSYREKLLRSLAFQSYARFYVDVFWGWYEKTLWGPKMICSVHKWNDNLDEVFPPTEKNTSEITLSKAGFINKELVNGFAPVSAYSRMPMPKPQSSIVSAPDGLVFSWLEKGEQYGQRHLRTNQFIFSTSKFSNYRTIETNFHGLNSPVSGKKQEEIVIYTWSQSRHTSESFGAVSQEGHIEEFIRSQDIYFSVYDPETDSVLQTGILDDLKETLNDGRAEGEPKVVMLSPSRALLTWQVVNPEIPQADIWYAFLDNNGGQWIPTIQGVAVQGEGVESMVELVSAGDGKALLVWLNTSRDELPQSTIMASNFDGIDWRVPEPVSAPGDTLCNYLDVKINDDLGALIYTVFVEDVENGHHEKMKLIPWADDHFDLVNLVELCVDSVAHLQLPAIALAENGRVAVAVKTERLVKKEAGDKISQVDIFTGDLNSPYSPWKHIATSPFVCDTSKQVSELCLGFTGNDTILMLSQEYPLFATNTTFVPENGILFGHPYMSLVLRGFSITEEGGVEDVDENAYFLSIDDPVYTPADMMQLQCYPNPCSDHTFLKFRLDENSSVKVDLFDMQGNYLAELLGDQLYLGMYEMEINTSSLVSGTYVIRIVTDSSSASVKLIVQ